MKFRKFSDPVIIDSEPKAIELAEAIESYPVWAIDTETTGWSIKKKVSSLVDEVLCWTISNGKDRYFIYDPKFQSGDCPLEFPHYTEYFSKPLFNNNKIVKVFHNSKYDMHCFLNHGVTISQPIYDTMVMHWLVDERKAHDLKYLASLYFKFEMGTYHKLFGKRKPPEFLTNNFSTEEEWEEYFKLATEYATLDALITYMLYEELSTELRGLPWNDSNLLEYYKLIEVPFTEVLFKMERRGILIDSPKLEESGKRIEQQLDSIQGKINSMAGEHINVHSTPDLRRLLYEKFKLPVIAETPGGKSGRKEPATDEETLVNLQEHLRGKQGSEVVDAILQYRGVTKTKSTYIDGILRTVNTAPDKRMHGTLNQHITRTGRLSGSKPNMTNMPRPGSDDYNIRDSFISTPGKKLIIIDYSQAEIRMIAHLSGDEALIEDLKGDVYKRAFSRMFGIPEDQITDSQRKLSKIIVLGTNYGMGARTLSEDITNKLGWDKTEYSPTDYQNKIDICKDLLNKYFLSYSSMHRYIGDTPFIATAKAVQDGSIPVIRTLLGRYRRLPELLSPEFKYRSPAEREAVNTGPQGGVADLMRGVMLQVDGHPRLIELECYLLMQIHDEIVLEVPSENVDESLDIVLGIMRSPLEFMGIKLDVPLEAEYKISDRWEKA